MLWRGKATFLILGADHGYAKMKWKDSFFDVREMGFFV